jgi:hypothetical protein
MGLAGVCVPKTDPRLYLGHYKALIRYISGSANSRDGQFVIALTLLTPVAVA